MHIAVDATCWHNNRGYGRHARALLNRLITRDRENAYTLFTDVAMTVDAPPGHSEVRVLQSSTPAALAASANGHRSIRDMWRMSRALSSPEFDLVLFPTVYSYVPTLTRARKVIIIHDVIAETYPHLTVPKKISRVLWRAKVGLGRRQADALVTVSDYSRRGIVQQFGLPSERVFVVGEASDPIFRRLDGVRATRVLNGLGITGERPIVTYVGGFGPHKNLEALVNAYGTLIGRPEFADTLLVMVGEHKNEVFYSYFETISQQVRRLGLDGKVIFTGYLPDEELVVLLNLSSVLALPSLMEGFGLPAIEAAACGCPVIATTESPLPELLGDGGIFIDPRSNGLEEALSTVLSSGELQNKMREAGTAAAAKLTWDTAAEQMMHIIRTVAVQ